MRAGATAALLLLSGVTGALARADNVAYGTYFCDGTAIPSTGEGSLSQVSVHTDVFVPAFSAACLSESGRVNYVGTGDQQGIQSLTGRTRPFVGSDVPLTAQQKAQMETAPGRASLVHQIPLYVDGWAIAYNVPCAGPQINLRSNVLSLIYSGVITKWNDRALVTDNAWLAGCNEPIRLTKRSDVAGATAVFQDYLSKRNPHWVPFKQGVAGQQWPTLNFACSGGGEGGMVNCIKTFRGSIGYVRMSVAASSGLTIAKVENSSGSFVSAGATSCSAAAAAAVLPPGTTPMALPPTSPGIPTRTPYWPATIGDWSTVSMTDAPDGADGSKSYPICSFSYLFVLQQWYGGYGGNLGSNAARGVVDYFTVALYDSTQASLTGSGLAPLPAKGRELSRAGIGSVSFYYFTPLEGAFSS